MADSTESNDENRYQSRFRMDIKDATGGSCAVAELPLEAVHVQKLLDALQCNFCNQILSNPVTLFCGHSVCLSHLPAVSHSTRPRESENGTETGRGMSTSTNTSMDPDTTRNSSPFRPISCPIRNCNLSKEQTIVLPLNGVSLTLDRPLPLRFPIHLSVNLRLAHLVTLVSEITADQRDQPLGEEAIQSILEQLTCGICLSTLEHPVTTPCQHSFCLSCLQKSMDHSPLCPLCRYRHDNIAQFHSPFIDKCLQSIVTIVSHAVEVPSTSTTPKVSSKDNVLDTPIFVCQLSFPGLPTLLHIFEPRYRLMLRRALQQPVPQFGMIMYPVNETQTVSYGTMLRVRSVKILSDGRSVIDTWGTHRFRILERGERDGYVVGRVETIYDLSVEMEREIERNATLPIPPRTPPIPLHSVLPAPISPGIARQTPLLPSTRPAGGVGASAITNPLQYRSTSPSLSIASTTSSAHSIRSAPPSSTSLSHHRHYSTIHHHQHQHHHHHHHPYEEVETTRRSHPHHRTVTSRFSISSLTRPFISPRPTTARSTSSASIAPSTSYNPQIYPDDVHRANNTHNEDNDDNHDDDDDMNEHLTYDSNTATSTTPIATTKTAPIPTTTTPRLQPFNYPLEPTKDELVATCHAFVKKLRRASSPIVLQRLSAVGPMPNDVSILSYWIALLLPIDEGEKAKLLPIRSPRLRLRLVVHWIDQFNAAWWTSGCIIA